MTTDASQRGKLVQIEKAAKLLHTVVPKREELRELLVFLFAGSLEGLSPVEAGVYLVRVSKLLDVGSAELRAAIERGLADAEA